MSQLSEIFHSSNNTSRYIDYGDIAHCLANGVISLSVSSIPIIEGNPYSRVGGSEAHKRLSHIALNWLQSLGLDTNTEFWVNGRRVDVVSKDLSILIECGDTSPATFIEHLNKPANKVCVLPFQSDKGNQLTLYVFERGENFTTYWKQRKQAEDNLADEIAETMSGILSK